MVDGEKEKIVDMLVVWMLTSLVASHSVVGLAGLGAGSCRGLYFAGDLWLHRLVLRKALVVGVQMGRKKLSARPGPCKTNFTFSSSSIQVQCMPLIQLIKPDTMKGSGMIPPIELNIRY